MTLLTPNPYSVQPGQCPVHEVRPGEAAMSRELSEYQRMRVPTIVQQALSGKPAQEGE